SRESSTFAFEYSPGRLVGLARLGHAHADKLLEIAVVSHGLRFLRGSHRAPATTTAAAKFHRPEGALPFAFRAFGWGRTNEGAAMTVASEILASGSDGPQACI